MKMFSKIIRAIERNSRQNERRKLVEELEDIFITRNYNDKRAQQIMERLGSLRRDDSCAYLNRDKPVKSVSQMIAEDDCGVPASYYRTKQAFDDDLEGLVGEWKAPV
jgi:hypothetical protein